MKIMFASFITMPTNIAPGSTVLGSRIDLLSFQSFVYPAFLHGGTEDRSRHMVNWLPNGKINMAWSGWLWPSHTT